MGLVLIPSEIKTGATLIKGKLKQNSESYGQTLQTINHLQENEALQSESWNTAKQKLLECHSMIVAGMSAAHKAMENDVSSMETTLDVGEELDEDELLLEIKRLTEECQRLEESINKLLELASNPFFAETVNVNDVLKPCYEMLEITKEELELLKKKLDKLYNVSQQTSMLFQMQVFLLAAIDIAISDAGVYITGKGQLSDGSWKKMIPAAVQSIETGMITPECYLGMELGIQADDFREMYGEELYREVCEYINCHVGKVVDASAKEQINTFILEKACDCGSAVVENGIYQLRGAKNRVMYEMKAQEIGAVVMDMAFANQKVKRKYIANYLMENLEISMEQTAAIMGNMYSESHFSPLISQNDNKDLYQPDYIEKYKAGDKVGWGLIQWTYPSRKAGLKDYADEKQRKSQNPEKSLLGDMDTQLEYLVLELTEGGSKEEFAKFREIKDVKAATNYFCDKIEIAGSSNMSKREQIAAEILAELTEGGE